jgi:alpha-glucosidase/alpha-D-xyloside xylohydrolase
LHNAAVEGICRKYLNLRYQMLPYIYSAVEQTHATGVPLMRALWIENPDDECARSCEDQYLFGPSLLIAPVVEPGAHERIVYLPQGKWWDMWTNEPHAGAAHLNRAVDLETQPVFVKAGSVVPTGPVKQHTGESSSEPITLTVYPGADGKSALYEDDGISFQYERGEFTRTELLWTESSRTLRLTANKPHPERRLRIVLAGSAPQEITFTGEAKQIKF